MPKMSFTDFLPAGAYRLRRAAVMTVGVLFMGFAVAAMRGSENNDAFSVENGKIVTETNRCGGILGGITDGMPIVLRAAFKPTPSIARTQQSVNLQSVTREELAITGRHDPCIVPRAVPCVEAAVAVAVYDALLARRKETR